MKKSLSLFIVLTLILSSFGAVMPVSADAAADLTDDFSTFGTENWVGYQSFDGMRYNTENANTVFGVLPTRLFGADWTGDVFLSYNGDFGGKMLESIFYVDGWYVNEQLAPVFPDVDRWGAFFELYQLAFAEHLEIYAGETYDSMTKIDADYVLGGQTPANGNLAFAVVVESLPQNTKYIKVQLANVNWVQRWGGIKITDDKSDMTKYDCRDAYVDVIPTPAPTPTQAPTPTPGPSATPDSGIVLLDDLNDFSKASAYENLEISAEGFVTGKELYPEHQDLNNPYKTNVARRPGNNNEASLTYSLDGVENVKSTTITVSAAYPCHGEYAGANMDMSQLETLDLCLKYQALEFYSSADGINFMPVEGVTLQKYPGPWKGQSSHFVNYIVKNLPEDTAFIKVCNPSIAEHVGTVNLSGWDPKIDYVKIEDKSLASAVTFVDNLDDFSKVSDYSANMITAKQEVVCSNALYPEHQDLKNPYVSNMARREGGDSVKTGYLVYALDEGASKAVITVDSFYVYNGGYAGAPFDASALDHLDILLGYSQLKFYESVDGVNFTEVSNVKLEKIPGPWMGQSSHYVGYSIKGLSEGAAYLKIELPSVEQAIEDGVNIDGWQPFIDTVTVKYPGGSSVVEDPMNSLSMLYDYSGNLNIVPNWNSPVSNALYPEHQDLNNPYRSSVLQRYGNDVNKEAYVIYEIPELPEKTKVEVDTFYAFYWGYAGAPDGATPLDHLDILLGYSKMQFYASADNVTYTPIEGVQLKKIPGPWGGQSSHYVGYTIKGLPEGTQYLKMVFPSVEQAMADGVNVDGWTPLIDNVKFTTSIDGGDVQQKLTLANVYMSDMVLQANDEITVAGMAAGGRTVTATITDGKNTTITASGEAASDDTFRIVFNDVIPASYTPYTMQVTDGVTTKTFTNILFGDVYLLTGQSNMCWTLDHYWTSEGEDSSAGDIQNADYPYLKVLRSADVDSTIPTEDFALHYKWRSIDSSNAGQTGALPFYIGTKLLEKRDYPIGLVDAAWGGQSVSPFLKNGVIYNNHIYPLRDFSFKGCMWYQGEAEAFYPQNTPLYYTRHLKLIEDFRALFGADLPFLLVQLENYENDEGDDDDRYPAVRQAQLDVFQYYENKADAEGKQNTVGIISIIDQMPKVKNNQHPEGKRDVARRMVDWANAVIYGEDGVYAGPTLMQAVKTEGKIELTYRHVGDGLVTNDGGDTVNCYRITDSQGVTHDVTGTISGNNKVIIETDIADPVSIGYASDPYNYNANLMNSANLAAVAFTAAEIVTSAVTDVEFGNAGTVINTVSIYDGAHRTGKVVVGAYSGNKLLAVRIVDLTEADYTGNTAEVAVNLDLSGFGTEDVTVKVLALSGLDNVQPMVNVYKR